MRFIEGLRFDGIKFLYFVRNSYIRFGIFSIMCLQVKKRNSAAMVFTSFRRRKNDNKTIFPTVHLEVQQKYPGEKMWLE